MSIADGLPKFKKRSVPVAPVESAGIVAEKEINAVREAFIARAETENKRYLAAIDSEFWVAIVFQSRAQKEAFLTAMGLQLYGDKYLDGQRVAHKFNVVLPPGMATKPLRKPDRKLVELIAKELE